MVLLKQDLKKRFWEIDFLRGIAIVLMIIFHFVYDLNYFGIYNSNLRSGFLFYLGCSASIIFILLVGISLSLSFSRLRNIKTIQKKSHIKYLKRGMKIFSWGLIITLITWIFLKEGFIFFGILHFIGISIIIAYPFLKYSYLNLLVGIIVIIIGVYLRNFTFDFNWLVWLGFIQKGSYTFDYYPVLPWFGLVLIGLFIGNTIYQNYERKFNLPDLSSFHSIRAFCFLGRYSLFIYLIHQPILIIILYIVYSL